MSVRIDHDTAAFAVNAIRSWWQEMASITPSRQPLLITADSGGSNSARGRLWKTELQRTRRRDRPPLIIRHLPPGTSVE